MKYKVPFVNYPLQYQNIKEELFAEFDRVLSKGDLLFRDDLIKLEKDIAKYSGCKYGVSCDSCTGGLYLSLLALDIKPGDEVITVAHTYIATIDVIKHCGATPILVDVDKDYNIDVNKIESVITNKTKAIIPVHLNGRLADMNSIIELAKKYNLKVVEDAAQALGAKQNEKPAGSWGDTGCFSFYPAKILGSYGDGGMVVTNNKELAKKMYLLRDHGELPGYLSEFGDGTPKKIYLWGHNSLLDNMQAVVLNIKFKQFPNQINRRREIAKIYENELGGIKDLIIMPKTTDEQFRDVYQNYVIRTKKRNKLVKFLENNGVETIISWQKPNHKQEALGLTHYNLPETESISNEVVSIPMYPELTDEQIQYVIKTIKGFFTNGT